MKTSLPIFLFLLVFSNQIATAQRSGVSLELHYPIAIPDDRNYVNEVIGIIGGSIQFQFSNNDTFNYGIKYKFDQLASRATYEGSSHVDNLNFLIHNVNAIGLLHLDREGYFIGTLEGGVSFYKYRENNMQPAYFGFNLSPGFVVSFNEQFYGFANYSYVKTSLKQRETDYSDTEKMQMIRIGFGFKL